MPAKKTVRRKPVASGRPAPGAVAEFPTVDAAEIETAPSLPEEASKGPVLLVANSDRKKARLLQKLMAAEDEASEWAAIADEYVEKYNAEAKRNRELTEHVRALEAAMFKKNEEKGDNGEGEDAASRE